MCLALGVESQKRPCFPRDLVFQVKVQGCDREVILSGLSEVSASDAGSEGIPSW